MDETEELRPNKFIADKLKAKEVEIIGFSTHRKDLKEFSGETDPWGLGMTPKVTEELFSFLLENIMNRYLFNLMIRKSANIESWPITDQDLIEKNLKLYTFEQSFVRIYKCNDCKYLLKRIYSPQLSTIPNDIVECPNCGLEKLLSPADYEYSFQLIRKDLKSFSEKLKEIGVLQSKKYVLCSGCDLELGIKNDELFQTTCPRCRSEGGKYIERNELSQNFLNLCRSESGLWFEWFIYEIAKRIYDHTDNGLILSYTDEDGNNQEKEVDIVALSDDKRLILIECKDYIGHTPPDQYRTIIKIADFFDDVYVVNFYKPHKDVNKMIGAQSNIKLLNGNDIEGVLLNNKLIISRLSADKVWFGGNPLASISKDKKIALIEEIIDNYGDRNNMRALINIFENKLIDPSLLYRFAEKTKEILNYQLIRMANIGKAKEDVSDSLRLIVAYIHFFDKEYFLNIGNPVEILDAVKGKIDLVSPAEKNLIRKVYRAIFNCHSLNDLDYSAINKNEFFNQVFDDLYNLYFLLYEWRDRFLTLKLIQVIFEKITVNKVEKFVDLIEKEFKTPDFHTGSVADKLFDIFSKNIDRFDEKAISRIHESANYLLRNGINTFVINSARKFLASISDSTKDVDL